MEIRFSEINIQRTAKNLVDQFGSDAEEVATQRMYELMEQDDIKGASIWSSILALIENLIALNNTKYLN